MLPSDVRLPSALGELRGILMVDRELQLVNQPHSGNGFYGPVAPTGEGQLRRGLRYDPTTPATAAEPFF